MASLDYDAKKEMTRKSREAIYAQVLKAPRYLVSGALEEGYNHCLTIHHAKYLHLEIFLRFVDASSGVRIEVTLYPLESIRRKYNQMHYTYFSKECSTITMAAAKCPLKILEDIERRVINRPEVEQWAAKVKSQIASHIEYVEREDKMKELMKGIQVGNTADLFCLEWDERFKHFVVRSYNRNNLTPEQYQEIGLALGNVVKRFNNNIQEF